MECPGEFPWRRWERSWALEDDRTLTDGHHTDGRHHRQGKNMTEGII